MNKPNKPTCECCADNVTLAICELAIGVMEFSADMRKLETLVANPPERKQRDAWIEALK